MQPLSTVAEASLPRHGGLGREFGVRWIRTPSRLVCAITERRWRSARDTLRLRSPTAHPARLTASLRRNPCSFTSVFASAMIFSCDARHGPFHLARPRPTRAPC